MLYLSLLECSYNIISVLVKSVFFGYVQVVIIQFHSCKVVFMKICRNCVLLLVDCIQLNIVSG